MRFVHSILRVLQAALGRQVERWSHRPGAVLLCLTAITAVSLGLLVASPRSLRPTYQFEVGDFAEATIRAPWDLSVSDEVATARMRDEAARFAAPVARFDPSPATTVPARIVEVFGRARDLIAHADEQRIVPAGEMAKLGAAARRRASQVRARDADRAVQTVVQDMLAQVDLQLGVVLTPDERTLLATGRFDRRVEDGLLALFREAYSRPIVGDLPQLRNAAARSQRPGEPAQVVLRAGGAVPDRALPDAAMLDDVPGAIRRLHARAPYLTPGLAVSEQAALVGLASRLVKPDTAYDDAATAQRRARAAADVLPVSLHFRRNQLIVDEGREVTREALLVLEALRQQGLPHAFLARAAGATALAWALLVALLWLPHRLGLPRVAWRDAAFLLVASTVATAAFWVWLMLADSVSARAPGMPRMALLLLFPSTAAPMLAGLVLPRRLVVGLAATVAVMAGFLTDLGVLYAAHTFVIGLVGAQLVAPCRQRSCVIRAGAQSGTAAVVTGFGVVALAGPDGDVVAGLTAMAGAFAGASAGALVALAFSRLAEWAFGYSTKLRLVELLSYEHPLLRQFMERAPGTFQHSVAVALLGRAAADAIGADTLLVRVGALYHDVGKMEHPLYFTENQRDENPHDGMAPADSARVILNHVADGVRLLRQHGVGARIEEFAREHQGTGALTVFQQKAEAAGGAVNPDDFRYPGPRPRSRETAILMMADKIEATARSVGAKTTGEFRRVVDRTIDTLQGTGQFDDSPLTLRDLMLVRQAFASALSDVHHTRVAYPAATGPVGPVGRV